MTTPPRVRFGDLMQLLAILVVAAALRAGYLNVAVNNGYGQPALVVQGSAIPAAPDDHAPHSLRQLVGNIAERNTFAYLAPLATQEEPTAHTAPGYAWLVAQFLPFDSASDAVIRWSQCGLGVLTVAFVFFFARRAFDSGVVAFAAGLLAAVHPFWIVNTAEIADGVVSTFLLTTALMLGARGSQSGGAFTSLMFGLSLAALTMVRAALLPFTIVALLWFLYQCKTIRYGWFNAVLAFLGFANGLAPWAVRNWREFEEPVPVVTSAYLHLWIGNNPSATGGPFDDAMLRKSLPEGRLAELLDETNEAKRYAMLAPDVAAEVMDDPAATIKRRWQAGLKFIVGDTWVQDGRMHGELVLGMDPGVAGPPEGWAENLEIWLQGSLLALCVLGLLGWRWSYVWKKRARLATLALLWVPLPYLLSHAEALSGPRLPWDAVLICFSAYALVSWVPSVAGSAEPE